MKYFKNSLDFLNENRRKLKLTTGNADLNNLLGGGIEQGKFYLFYGEKNSSVDYLIHQLAVNSLLPMEEGGFEGKCIYSNCGNYREERTIFDTSLLCYLIKNSKLDLNLALDKIYTICSFSEDQEEVVFDEIQGLLQRDVNIKLVLVHNIAKLFTTNRGTPNKIFSERIKRLQKVVFQLSQVCAENNLALVASCRSSKNLSQIPKPEGGKYLRHKATVIVYFKKKSEYDYSAVLIKHPNLAARKIDFSFNKGSSYAERPTVSFRILLQMEIDNLKRTYLENLVDLERKSALKSLLKTFNDEQKAMSSSGIPTVFDSILLKSTTDSRKLIEEIFERVKIARSKLEKLSENRN